MEKGVMTQLLRGLVRIGHKDLKEYVKDGLEVVQADPLLFAHAIAWNAKNGEIRDSKTALPVISMKGNAGESSMFWDNAGAHLLLLDPRNLVKSLRFHKEVKGKEGAGKVVKKVVSNYLSLREGNRRWWDRTVLQHRESMKTLYAMNHVKPNGYAQRVLFDREYPKGSVFEAVKSLSMMNPQEAAGTILNHKVPFLIAVGAIGGLKKGSDTVLALIESMTPQEAITNANMLKNAGIMEVPALRSAFEAKLALAAKDKGVSSLKAQKAASVIGDVKLKAKVEKAQEDKIDSIKGLEGNWLVCGDRSGSMRASIEKAREVSAVLARMVKGKVNLVFFNEMPTYFDVTAKSLEEIKSMTRGVTASGCTMVSSGLLLIMQRKEEVNGIIIVSDGGENRNPRFCDVYRKYADEYGTEPNVYLLHVPGDTNTLTSTMKDIPFEEIDVSRVDYYSMPNLVKTMKSSRFGFIDELMSVPLLTMQEVIDNQKGRNYA